MSTIPATEALAAPDRAPGENPFKLGVASGDPTASATATSSPPPADRRGYVRCRVEAAQMRVDLRMVTTVSRPDAPEATFASFVVESGHPGARPD